VARGCAFSPSPNVVNLGRRCSVHSRTFELLITKEGVKKWSVGLTGCVSACLRAGVTAIGDKGAQMPVTFKNATKKIIHARVEDDVEEKPANERQELDVRIKATKIECVPIGRLKPNRRNAKKHPSRQIALLVENYGALCLSEIKFAHTDDEVRPEMALAQCDQRLVLLATTARPC
jgi:hypothetical protein